jgi:hypothetical protein
MHLYQMWSGCIQAWVRCRCTERGTTSVHKEESPSVRYEGIYTLRVQKQASNPKAYTFKCATVVSTTRPVNKYYLSNTYLYK